MRISRARSADAARLTRIAFAAKRTWGYPDDWIRQWAGKLTITPAYLRRHPTFCARVGKSIARPEELIELSRHGASRHAANR